MDFTGAWTPPRCSVRDMMTPWMTASMIGAPRLGGTVEIADAGPKLFRADAGNRRGFQAI
ncbi:hypothetical protein A5696_12485 [Mycobacterium sp. E2699]|nr:hypothetical protein A5696_12485 [Mycobacterium sp. E2699]OBI49181.1 hypothetical protein A5705_13955 [Mycobacterium sp. E787]